ncbi:hypothetical protein FACS189472_08920 [Alphaproteobacteria bacterium]|nr:hypothetical protein FACS189472_08920 [Alphaproteobacteria bacterium]
MEEDHAEYGDEDDDSVEFTAGSVYERKDEGVAAADVWSCVDAAFEAGAKHSAAVSGALYPHPNGGAAAVACREYARRALRDSVNTEDEVREDEEVETRVQLFALVLWCRFWTSIVEFTGPDNAEKAYDV